MENKSPLSASRSLNTAQTAKSPLASKSVSPYVNGAVERAMLSPPPSQTVDATKTLISPPPEETLRSSRHIGVSPPLTKRKRQTAHTVQLSIETTPNPKPRKQNRRSQSVASPTHLTCTQPSSSTPHRRSLSPTKRVLVQSPHAANPDADFILPGPASDRRFISRARRSATPVPSYEPPRERFTPPREVLITPTKSAAPKQSKSSKRKSAPAKPMKREPPEIDLSAPLPPPSPTDDPLLLSDPPTSRVYKLQQKHSARITPSIASTSPIRSAQEDLTDIDMDTTGVDNLPLFNFDNAIPDSGGGWSDSDSDMEPEGEGEYTGRFTMMKVPTKADPPTSGTRDRMDRWGRPVSPFPRVANESTSLRGVGEELEVQDLQETVQATEEYENHDEDDFEVRQVSPDPEDGPMDASPTPDDISGDDISADDDMITPAGLDTADFSTTSPFDRQTDPPDTTTASWTPTRDFNLHTFTTREPSEEEQEEEIVDRELSREPVSDTEEEEPREEDQSPSPHGRVSTPRHDSPLQPALGAEEEGPSHHTYLDDTALTSRHDSLGHDALSPALDAKEESIEKRQSPYPHDREAFTPCHDPLHHDALSPMRDVDSPSPAQPSTEAVIVRAPRYNDSIQVVEDDDSESDSSDEYGSLVKITSSDPRAAARAAAILKLHDYDCLSKTSAKQRRHSHSTLDSVSRSARRRNTAASGVSKSRSPSQTQRRRTTLGGMIGDKVIIPGSPMMTLPELLRDAEAGLGLNESSLHFTPISKDTPSRDPFKTPLPRRSMQGLPVATPPDMVDGIARPWTRDDWKQLDACFTDERLDLGARQGLGYETLADVDDVQVEAVVTRFISLMGGPDAVDNMGLDWNQQSLITRARALQKKQRFGNVAPPTPKSRVGPPSEVVPEFTPLPRRSRPRMPKPRLPAPLTESPFRALPVEKPTVHGSLLAPRYSHLLEEALSVSRDVPSEEVPAAETKLDDASQPLPDNVQTQEARPKTIGKRVKGFLYSYLPTLSKSTHVQKPQPAQPGLPLPPPEVLSKPRGPVVTPVRPPTSKPIPPRDMVHLQHAPIPPKASMIPRASKPRRLVELHPPPAPPPTQSVEIPRPRRSSGGSVKDLVRSFEQMEDRRVSDQDTLGTGLRRMKSNGNWKENRPTWRP